ncbi:uncharacterized protein LY79DRAFT_149877 [Colletotrichum navitas]|uniref:Secreted protein n=1 Tax=Colletotrichum navitas TaxID=681940 RepID=A0AAD8QC97_9PEZI|nr:uncharacterized protein LY79DRAFT_149877 [Colletotrichum navitas]KAK1599724.1 hypothetical protein LY79DRAFT_149877 [Colletotrichum navitas]
MHVLLPPLVSLLCLPVFYKHTTSLRPTPCHPRCEETSRMLYPLSPRGPSNAAALPATCAVDASWRQLLHPLCSPCSRWSLKPPQGEEWGLDRQPRICIRTCASLGNCCAVTANEAPVMRAKRGRHKRALNSCEDQNCLGTFRVFPSRIRRGGEETSEPLHGG